MNDSQSVITAPMGSQSTLSLGLSDILKSDAYIMVLNGSKITVMELQQKKIYGCGGVTTT